MFIGCNKLILLRCFMIVDLIKKIIELTNSSAFSFANRSASRARLSLSFNENIATERALLTSFCLSLDFLAAISAARCSSSVLVAFGTEGALAPIFKILFIKIN